MAGLNAARRAQELAPIIIPRHTSYIGTLIDDLVTKVLSSPMEAQSRLASGSGHPLTSRVATSL